jgi:adenine-specific DNA-methyltransferase
MPHERLKPEFLFDDDKIAQLKHVAPEAFEDGKINFETLRHNLGDWVQREDSDLEYYGLFWPGKKDARKFAATPPEGTLEPVFGEGLKSDGTTDEDGNNDSKNIFIEGENLEVLKILQKSYANAIKMIYIDPPYNTGNDFVYDDDFTEPTFEYLKRTGQIDEGGKPQTTNKTSDGRFHSKWLSMMYPRLRLARNLLKDDGVIFVSIDDHEVHNLRAIMNEIFGEENFRAEIIWQHSIQPKGYTGKFSLHHNYTLCYTKDYESVIGTLERTEEHNKNYSNPDDDPNGKWRSGDVRNSLYRKNLIYDVPTPSGKVIPPPKNGWRWSWETMQDKINSKEIVFNADESWIMRKIYLKNLDGRTPESIWFGKEVGTTRDGIKELKRLFDDKPPFDTPKPTGLIKRMLEITTEKNDEEIVLDFFSGSGTTGHSVMDKNAEDLGNRKFILVQLQEDVDESTPAGKNAIEMGYLKLNQVLKERLKRVSNNKPSDIDSGFKTYKQNISNFKNWEDIESLDIKQIELSINEYADTPLRIDWNRNKLLTEIMMLEGFPLDASQTKLTIGSNEIIKVESEMVPNSLLICLDDSIEGGLINDLNLSLSVTFVCLDTAISNENKIRLSDKGLIKTI